MGATEIPQHVFLRIAAFLICDHDATVLAQHRDSAGHRFVVAKQTVAVQFVPIRETTLDIIEGEGPLYVPRDLHPLPGVQVIVNLTPGGLDLGLHCFDFGIKIEGMLVRMIADFLQPALQLHDWLFELER